MKMITSTPLTHWRDLQHQAGRILTECGYTTQVEATVKAVRGTTELDVLAEEAHDGRTTRIACECKFWQTAVPKGEVHDFRSRMADIGIDTGFLIAPNGHQSGAHEATQFTSVHLVTWEEFQNYFQQRWLDRYLSPRMTEDLDGFMRLVEPFPEDWMNDLTAEDEERIDELKNRYAPLSAVIMQFSTYYSVLRKNGYPPLPLPYRPIEVLPEEVRNAVAYREFMEACLRVAKQVEEEFSTIKTRNAR